MAHRLQPHTASSVARSAYADRSADIGRKPENAVAKDSVAFKDADQFSAITVDANQHLRKRIAIEKKVGTLRTSGYLSDYWGPPLWSPCCRDRIAYFRLKYY